MKRSLLVIIEILRRLVGTLAVDDKYCFHKRENLPQLIQMQLSQKQNTSSQFLMHFGNMNQVLNILKKKKMNLIAYVFSKL